MRRDLDLKVKEAVVKVGFCSCVRQTELPNTTRLFADVLYHPDRTAPFYRHPMRELEAFQAAAGQIEFSAERRAALIDAFRVQNPESPALERLAQPGTVAVITGQQVGLFSGPSYTIYKVLHAIQLAEWLSENGLPAVPVFWLATEDHDFAEVNHAWVFGADQQPRKLEMRRTSVEQPVGDVALVAPPIRELRAAMHGLPFGEEVADLWRRATAPATPWVRRSASCCAACSRNSTSCTWTRCCRPSANWLRRRCAPPWQPHPNLRLRF